MVVGLETAAGDCAHDLGPIGPAVRENLAALLLAVLGLHAHVLENLHPRFLGQRGTGPGEIHQRNPRAKDRDDPEGNERKRHLPHPRRDGRLREPGDVVQFGCHGD